jgi:hypothetical protein
MHGRHRLLTSAAHTERFRRAVAHTERGARGVVRRTVTPDSVDEPHPTNPPIVQILL